MHASLGLMGSIEVDRKCIIIIRSTGATDRATWTDMWGHAATVTAMCAKLGKKGVWTQIGTFEAVVLQTYSHVDIYV